MNRTTLIALVVVAIIALGGAVYFLFFTGSPSVTVAPAGSASLPVAGKTPAQTSTNGSGNGTGGTNSVPNAPVAVTARLVQISSGPVVPGEVVVDIKAANASSSPTTAVSYIDRSSGNVFSYTVGTKTITRTNNKTVPGIQSASWLPDASLAFVRYLSGTDFSTINTYALPSTTATSSTGFFLPQNLSDISVSSTSVLTLASGVNGSIASLSRTDGTKPVTLFTTPLTSLRASYAGKNQYLAYTKPSATLSGYAYLVSSLGRFSRIAGPESGLVALASPSGKWVLVSSVQGSTMQMELINTATNASIPLPVATIADKCVWTNDDSSIYCGVPISPSSSYAYPDDWYQGAVQFSDRIWKIDVAGRFAQLVLDFKDANSGTLDAYALALNPSRTTLVFVNKNNSSLWSYSL